MTHEVLYLVRSFSKLLSCFPILRPYLLALEVSKFTKETFVSRDGQISVRCSKVITEESETRIRRISYRSMPYRQPSI